MSKPQLIIFNKNYTCGSPAGKMPKIQRLIFGLGYGRAVVRDSMVQSDHGARFGYMLERRIQYRGEKG